MKIIIGMSIVTYLPRMLPLVILSKVKLPAVFINWLKYIPVAVLSALLLPGILINGKKLDFSLNNHAMIAAIPCFIAAILSKNMFVTVVTGVVSTLVLTVSCESRFTMVYFFLLFFGYTVSFWG